MSEVLINTLHHLVAAGGLVASSVHWQQNHTEPKLEIWGISANRAEDSLHVHKVNKYLYLIGGLMKANGNRFPR
jgi:hypothetical protein